MHDVLGKCHYGDFGEPATMTAIPADGATGWIGVCERHRSSAERDGYLVGARRGGARPGGARPSPLTRSLAEPARARRPEPAEPAGPERAEAEPEPPERARPEPAPDRPAGGLLRRIDPLTDPLEGMPDAGLELINDLLEDPAGPG